MSRLTCMSGLVGVAIAASLSSVAHAAIEPALRGAPLTDASASAGTQPDSWTPGNSPALVPAPLPAAHCQIHVVDNNFDAWLDTELDYVPHVVQCENGGASYEALKAQAIAARSVAYYAMETSGKICDSQGCQVYGCGYNPTPEQLQAALDTAGQYLSFNDTLTYAFYVAGDSSLEPPGCVGQDADAGTEKFVTYNEGKTGFDVEQTTLGYIHNPGDPGYGQNRGCMSQWGARCLEDQVGYDHVDILRFYYGADIQILQAQGPCVEDPDPDPDPDPPSTSGALEQVDCDAIVGWAYNADDLDEQAVVELLFDASSDEAFDEPGATLHPLTAARFREDLCDLLGDCEHGFEHEPPRSLRDGQEHSVRARVRGFDGGPPELIEGSPQSFTCARLEIPDGVSRPVDNAAIGAWGFDPFWQGTVVTPAELEAIEAGSPVPEAPALVMSEETDGTVWLLDGEFRRRVPDLSVLAAWGLEHQAPETWSEEALAGVPEGPPLRDAPFLIRLASGALHLIDDVPCAPGSEGCEPSSSTTGSGDATTGDGGETDGPDGTDADTAGAVTAGASAGAGGEIPESGCGCTASSRARGSLGWFALVLLGLVRVRVRVSDRRRAAWRGSRG